MAVPKRRVSSTRRDKRRTHDKLTPPTITTCPQCKAPVLAHTACKSCGYYDGAKVLETVEERKERRDKSRADI